MTNHVTDKRTWRTLMAAIAAIALLAACGEMEAPGGGPEGTVTGVEITGTTTVQEGSTTTLTANVTADEGVSEAVHWTSDNESAATVNANGVVNGLSEGTATITATSQVNEAQSDSVEVSVVPAGTDTGDDGSGDDGSGGGSGGDFEPVPDPADPGTDVASVVSATTFSLNAPTDGGATYDVYALADGETATADGTQIGTGVAGDATLDLPGAGTPWIRIVDGDSVVAEGTIEGFVHADADYDVYIAEGVDHTETPIPGTLRWAVDLAEDGDVIAVAPELDLIRLHGVRLHEGIDAHLMIDRDVTIYGNDVTLEGVSAFETGDPGDDFTYNSRMLYVAPIAEVVLDGFTVTGGTFIYHGAGIMNHGHLTVRDSTITGNRAWHTGGGITTGTDSTLILTGSSVTNNLAYVETDEIGVDFEIRGGPGSTQPVGDGGWGGGLYANAGATVTIDGTVFSGNRAKVGGGGVYVRPTADVTMRASDVSGNVAEELAAATADEDRTNFGGGIYTDGALDYGNGTIGQNDSENLGGGMYIGETADVTLAAATVDTNVADYGGGIYHVPNAAGDNLTPDDPVASAEVNFTGNTSTATGADDDYIRADPPSGASALRAGDALTPTEPLQGSKRY